MPSLEFFTPRCSVKLFKSISRRPDGEGLPASLRYSNKDDGIDLTPFMGDGSSIVTEKSIDSPTGTFTLTFLDKPQNVGEVVGPGTLSPGLESVYGLVESMDAVEIRMWSGKGRQPDPLPIKMRGIVTRVRRERSMSPDGKPRRVVIITGHDYGKFLQMYQLLYLSGYDGAKPLLTAHNFFEQFGMDVTNTMTCGDFVKTLLKQAINPLIEELFPNYNSMPHNIVADLQSHGMMSNSFQNERGSVYDLAKTFMDVDHWNEFFIQDRESGVYLVWRPKPYFDLMTGDNIQDMPVPPAICTISNDMIMSISQQRDDEDVYNYFYTSSERWQMLDDRFQQMMDVQNNYHQTMMEYANTAVKYYGLRAFYSDVVAGPELDDFTNMGSGQDQATQDKRMQQMSDWLLQRREICVQNNKDNVVYESGEINMKGGALVWDPVPASSTFSGTCPLFKRPAGAGDYFEILDGKISWTCYATAITDTFQPYRSYTSTIQFIRGTGFAERVSKNGGKSPWTTDQGNTPTRKFGSDTEMFYSPGNNNADFPINSDSKKGV